MSHDIRSLVIALINPQESSMSRDIRIFLLAVILGVSLLAAFPCPAAASGQVLEERAFRLEKFDSERVVFSVTRAGALVVRARVKEPLATTPVKLLLEGPGGLRVEKEGSAPLRLRYHFTGAMEPETWHASVINVSRVANVTGKLTVELQDPKPGTKRRIDGVVTTGHPETGEAAPGDAAAGGEEPAVASGVTAPPAARVPEARATRAGATDGKVSYANDPRLRAVCRDRNLDVSLRLDLDQGTGVLLLRSNHVFSFAAHQTSDERIEIRGSGQHALYLDLGRETLSFASGEEGTFCRVRIYRGQP